MSSATSTMTRPTTAPTATDDRPVSLSLALFQSIGDPVMQCVHGASLLGPCGRC